jgi:hypothetical protein
LGRDAASPHQGTNHFSTQKFFIFFWTRRNKFLIFKNNHTLTVTLVKMMVQQALQICGRQFTDADMALIRNLIAQDPSLTRTALSRQVCDLLRWLRPDGRRKDMSCRVALLKLERQGLITLPAPTRVAAHSNHYALATPLSLFEETSITQSVEQLHALSLVLVTAASRQQSHLWNELIARYHYLGYKPLVGAQRRYLIHSRDGWLGAVGFSAAAWKVAPRDLYIGWSAAARQVKLHYVVCNSRFLILPWVRSPNLASKVLSLCAKRIAQDWQQAYGFKPLLLETYVDRQRFRGSCYRAANWIAVGQTQGRGKLDRHHHYALPVKDVYLYPLHDNFRELLCQPLKPL